MVFKRYNVKPPEYRFWSKIDLDWKTGCWNWAGSLDKDGYGQFSITHEKTVRAHRFSYELVKRSIPNELEIDHLCRNKKCVNPNHLEAVTSKENSKRGLAGLVNGLINIQKTHCIRGHPLSGDNLYVNPNTNKRACKICRNTSMKKFKIKRGIQ